MLHDLTEWVLGFATSDWAIVALAINSFAESIFFPVPPDPLLIAIAIAQPELALWLGALVSVTSVAGALVAHWIGRRLSRPILQRFFSDRAVGTVERMIQRYGVWATLMAAFTPLPYKLFAISAGAFDLDRRTFLLASLVGRGARFMTLSLLVFIFGESIQRFISDNFGTLPLGLAAVLVVGIVVWGLIRRARGARDEPC